MASLQDVFVEHFDEFARGRRLHPRESQAARAIGGCFRGTFGSHLVACPHGHVVHEQFHACAHRSCPRCAERRRQAWVDAELQRLLPCPHFHAVFTLPHELLELWAFNRESLIALLMHCVRECLLQMMADPRHLGATPGILLSLHTWGRNLSYHPHVHALVSAGGLRADGSWAHTRAGFLLPLAPLRKLFCGKFLGQLRTLLHDDELRLPAGLPREHWLALAQRLYRKHWNVQINPPYANGRSVALYLARYAKGGPLPRERTLELHNHHVSFDYTDHRDHRRKRLTLPAHAFIARVLWHAPPKAVHTTRHAGLYASTAKLQHTRALLGLHTSRSTHHASALPSPAQRPAAACPTCGCLLRTVHGPGSPSRGQISSSSRTTPPAFAPPAVPLGSTGRSNGQPTAKAPRPQPPPYHLVASGGGL